MPISVGNELPDAQLLRREGDGIGRVNLHDLLANRKVILFTVPGAFTRSCTAIHVPSYINEKKALNDKGIDDIICVSVNDPFVMDAWADATGGKAAGLTFLADSGGDFAKAIGRNYDYVPDGMFNRCRRLAAVVDNGIVQHLLEDEPGQCRVSVAGEILDLL